MKLKSKYADKNIQRSSRFFEMTEDFPEIYAKACHVTSQRAFRQSSLQFMCVEHENSFIYQ